METENEFEKIENLIVSQVGTVKKLLAKKHSLILPGYCDDFVVRCLRLKDGNAEKAVKLILSYQTTISGIGDWGVAIQPTAYTDLYKKGLISILRQSDSLGRRVCIVRTKSWDLHENSYEECIMALWMMCEHCNGAYKDVPRDGYVAIWDFSNFTWQQAWAVNQWRLLTAAKWAQNGVGGRVRALHVVFHPKAVGFLYAGVRPFLKEKLRKRVNFHDSLDSLHRFVSPKILPDYLGGLMSHQESSDEIITSELLAKDKYFQEMISQGFPSK